MFDGCLVTTFVLLRVIKGRSVNRKSIRLVSDWNYELLDLSYVGHRISFYSGEGEFDRSDIPIFQVLREGVFLCVSVFWQSCIENIKS